MVLSRHLATKIYTLVLSNWLWPWEWNKPTKLAPNRILCSVSYTLKKTSSDDEGEPIATASSKASTELNRSFLQTRLLPLPLLFIVTLWIEGFQQLSRIQFPRTNSRGTRFVPYTYPWPFNKIFTLAHPLLRLELHRHLRGIVDTALWPSKPFNYVLRHSVAIMNDAFQASDNGN